MSKQNILWGVLITIVLIGSLWIIRNGQEKFSWRETYKIDSQEPYGLYAAYQLMEAYAPGGRFYSLKDSLAGMLPLKDAAYDRSNYLFIGEGLYMREQDRDALLAFVDAGNTAFLSARELPYDLMFYLYFEECDDTPWNGLAVLQDSVVALNFKAASLRQADNYHLKFIQKFSAKPTHWTYFPDKYLCPLELGLEPLGTLNDTSTNLVRIPYGQGYFYLHTQPRVFTNYHLLTEEGKVYAQLALSYLNDGPIYWDEFSRVPERMAQNQNNQFRNQPQQRLQSQNPLQYILEQPPLAWAWYTLVTMGLLFLLFRTKRRQRVIPVSHPVHNTSLEFVKTIGWLYYQKSEHQQLAVLAIKNLRIHVKEHYGLQWRNEDPQFIDQLSKRAGIEREKVAQLAKDVKNIPQYSELVETELVKFHQRLEYFYSATK
jgi:hypothetical protein